MASTPVTTLPPAARRALPGRRGVRRVAGPAFREGSHGPSLCRDELDVSLDTARSHVRSIDGKLQVHTVAGAASRALRERLV